MGDFDRRAYWFALSKVQGLTAGQILTLVQTFGSAEQVFKASESALRSSSSLSPGVIARIKKVTDRKLAQAEEGVLYLENEGYSVLCYECDQFPEQLRTIPKAPIILYTRGRVIADFHRCVAVVGSRQTSDQAREAARIIAGKLSRQGFCVVSGLALGIDTEAHRGALDEGGQTIAVLGRGIDKADPRENAELFFSILRDGGGVMSEYLPGTPPSTRRYLDRNRITSGLSVCVIIIEARTMSGTYGTADAARRQNRLIMAIDWEEVTEENLGNERLLRSGIAEPLDVTDGFDHVVEDVRATICRYEGSGQLELFDTDEMR